VKYKGKAMELIRSRKGHLRGVGTGLELVREGLGQNPSRTSCESKGDDDWFLKEWKRTH